MSRPGYRPRVHARSVTYGLFAGVLVLAATRPVFNADLYVIDGGSGKTRAAVDYNDAAHWLDQSNTTLQSALPATHADFANKLCLTRVSGGFYQSNRTAAYWSAWHQGAGPELWAVWTPITSTTGFHFHTTSGFTGPGFGLGLSGANVIYQVKKPPDMINRSSAKPLATPQSARCTYLEGASPEAILQVSGNAATTQASVDAPDAATAQRALRWGWSGGDTFERVRSILAFPRLDAAGVALVQQAIHQDSGIAA